MWNEQSLQDLTNAVQTFDRSTSLAISEDLVSHVNGGGAVSAADATGALKLLRRNRYFEALKRVAEALTTRPTGDRKADAAIKRQLAQALIELGEFLEARRVLQPLTLDPSLGNEWAEAKGLKGRSYKQEYVNTARAGVAPSDAVLNAAIREYGDVYRTNPQAYYWHGINLVACLKRGLRDGLSPETDFDADAVARSIVAVLEPTLADDTPPYVYATVAEAKLALGDVGGAVEKLKEYISPRADAFEIASTLRQLDEVWQVREDSAGGPLISILRTALLKRDGGTVDLTVGELQRSVDGSVDREPEFEKTFGKFGAQTLTWYRQGLTRARLVGRVEDEWGRGIGTGFLIRAGDFFPSLTKESGDELMFMTNAHVMGRTNAGALPPAKGSVRFEALESLQNTVRVKEIVWESPTNELDATIVRLESAITGVDVVPVAPPDEPAFSSAQPRRLYVIGHPQGGELSVSIEDNLQVGWKRPKLHYRTPTLPGNSGSPVFDEHWRLIALHHMGSAEMPRLDGPGVYEANEGIWIHDILALTRAMAPSFESATPAPRPALRQGVFVSYSHRDKKWLDELTSVLVPMVDKEEIKVWDDRQIAPGQDWAREIEKAMEKARVAVFLVSTNFLASSFIARKEMAPLLEASQRRGLTIFWIPIGTSLYEKTELAKIQAAWDPKRPLNGMRVPDREKAWVEIAKKLEKAGDLNRFANMFHVADQVVLQASGLGGHGVSSPSVTARQTGESIEIRRGSHTINTITAEEMGQLDPQSQQFIRMHEAALVGFFDEYATVYPTRASGNSAERERAEEKLQALRVGLCQELNSILGFVESMGKQLDDHYLHVRAICGQQAG